MSTGLGPELIHVVGRAQPGDPVTAAARALCRTLSRLGHPGRLVAAAPCATDLEVAPLAEATEPTAIVHTVDGGAEMRAAIPALLGRRITVVHHGSVAGSDRGTLRALRGMARRAVAADASAREELRRLGFADVRVLDARAASTQLDWVAADPATADRLARHPGPMILAVGPVGPNRSLELLLDAFAHLITTTRPSATLAICGPSSPWYLASMRRRILAAGLVACDLHDPSTEGQVVARLDRADVLVALRPAALDPYLCGAARRGVPVVAPLDARTATLAHRRLVRVAARPDARAVAAALDAATGPRPAAAQEQSGRGEPVLDGSTIVRALAIR